jgi:hypothetical protein
MGSDEKISLSDAIVDKIKKNKFVVIVVALGTIASAGSAIIALWAQLKGLFEADITLNAINVVHSDAAPFRDFQGIPCLLQDKLMRTFAPESERHPGSPLELSFAFSNHSKFEAIFTEADFVVTHTQQTAGGGAGAIEPNHVYKMNLEFKEGIQPLKLNPPYHIPANDIGAFAIDLVPAAEGTGLCWILHIVFKTNFGNVESETFAVTMSKSLR